MAEGVMSELIASIGLFFTQAITWIGDVIGLITENPLLLIMVVCMPVAGVAIGYCKRLIRL